MSEAKFTKGPWRILDKYQVGVNVNFGDGFFTIASCQVFNEAKANANLIAAAPEMYEMLETLTESQNMEDAEHLLRENRLEILELLAKARGEQND
ncbi:coil containing protein [Vibrio phage 1.186.O._10N.286.49.E3]|nr:coil containing protein [Vibrio phage 1.186.O._10N.286.49.E3]